MQMETLQTGCAGADGPQAWNGIVTRPTHFAGVFNEQIAPGLMQLFHDHFAVRLLQIVRRRFRVPEKAVGRLDVVAVQEHLRNALSRIGRHCCGDGDGALIPSGITQIYFAEVLLRPISWGILMNCCHVQWSRSPSFRWVSKFQREFRA